MAFTSIVVPVLILLEIHICLSVEINRADFPNGFLFGTASSAFQYEGAVKEDGRAPSVWDTFSHTSGKVIDFSNADVAVDHYHRFEEDIQLMKDLGMDAYRLSISWSFFPMVLARSIRQEWIIIINSSMRYWQKESNLT